MKKSQLIYFLSKVEGDPDILFWNGFVEDWQEIDYPQEVDLVKYSLERLFKDLKHEKMSHKKMFKLTKQELKECYQLAKKQFQEQEWEFANRFIEQERYRSFYGDNQKSVYMMQAKRRNKESWDRLGGMKY